MNSTIAILTLVFTGFAGIAAIIYCFVAYRTLKEIKIQRETIYRPDIIVDENWFYIYGFKTTNAVFPVEYTYEKKSPSYRTEKFMVSSFDINLFNVGFAAAKEINIAYSFDIDTIVSKISAMNQNVPQDKIIQVTNHGNWIEFRHHGSFNLSSSHSIKNQLKRHINHLLPINVTQEPCKLPIPSYILELNSIIIYTQHIAFATKTSNLEIKELPDFPEMPIIKMNIEYIDIGNKKHEKYFELSIAYHGGTENESWGSFTVKEKAKG